MQDSGGGADRYTPSGRMGVRAIPAAVLAGAVVAVAGGFVYQATVRFLGGFVLVPLLTASFAGLLGYAVAVAVRWGKARNPRVAGSMGVLAGVFAVGFTFYVAYGWDAEAWAREAEMEIPSGFSAEDPSAQALRRTVTDVRAMSFRQFLEARVERGWNLGGFRADGPEVWAIWLFEALILCALGALVAATGGLAPFCEHCRIHTNPLWIGEMRGLDPAALRGAAPRRGISGLLALECGAGNVRLSFTLNACSKCDRTKFVHAEARWVKRWRIGRENGHRLDRRRETLLSNVVPTKKELEALTRRFPVTA